MNPLQMKLLPQIQPVYNYHHPEFYPESDRLVYTIHKDCIYSEDKDVLAYLLARPGCHISGGYAAYIYSRYCYLGHILPYGDIDCFVDRTDTYIKMPVNVQTGINNKVYNVQYITTNPTVGLVKHLNSDEPAIEYIKNYLTAEKSAYVYSPDRILSQFDISICKVAICKNENSNLIDLYITKDAKESFENQELSFTSKHIAFLNYILSEKNPSLLRYANVSMQRFIKYMKRTKWSTSTSNYMLCRNIAEKLISNILFDVYDDVSTNNIVKEDHYSCSTWTVKLSDLVFLGIGYDTKSIESSKYLSAVSAIQDF